VTTPATSRLVDLLTRSAAAGKSVALQARRRGFADVPCVAEEIRAEDVEVPKAVVVVDDLENVELTATVTSKAGAAE
jgi:hypothetical protein